MIDEGMARLEEALRRLGSEREPPPGWEARVLAAARARATRRVGWIVPLFAMATALLLVGAPAPPRELVLEVRRERVGPALRGGERPAARGSPGRTSAASVGDELHVRAAGGAGPRAIWIYLNETELVLTCPGAPACRAAGDALTAQLALASLGRYTVVALSSASPLPPPRGAYSADVAAAGDAGATVRVHELDAR